MKGDELAERLVDFGAGILGLVEALPKTASGRHVAEQIMRAGTSCGANYEEGRGAESRGDFVHKLSVTNKELKECRYWLKLIAKSKMLANGTATDALDECEELCAIISKSIATAKKNQADQ
ncbi:MAG: hypothetical protein A3G34_05220 [Candidatus Lindowbacteria bacterium RIFCSPLOWO2_12_FULL_62_27]|nr:MAG: hypothetical protein A3G34_05220 [Candidatus Lindowbacteria bacterium RIFCSPLOWO2_12_FULL_62_27]OGH61847.1 MAG: hypothetical protein A3I06_03935 [Candidatus Lindowbacteria bacterium RIFCSPLOWO2_02_FULL_62_12]